MMNWFGYEFPKHCFGNLLLKKLKLGSGAKRNVKSEADRGVLLLYLFLLVWNKRF